MGLSSRLYTHQNLTSVTLPLFGSLLTVFHRRTYAGHLNRPRGIDGSEVQRNLPGHLTTPYSFLMDITHMFSCRLSSVPGALAHWIARLAWAHSESAPSSWGLEPSGQFIVCI